jgi:hypothetical protein
MVGCIRGVSRYVSGLVPAFLLAPLATALLFCIVSFTSGGFQGSMGDFLFTGIVVYMFAFSATVTFALPIFLLLERFDMVRWWSAAVVGALLGVLYTFLIGPDSFSSLLLRGRIPLGLIGAISGLTFWLVLSHRLTQNRDAAKQ